MTSILLELFRNVVLKLEQLSFSLIHDKKVLLAMEIRDEMVSN